MKVVIFGATGTVGSQVVRQALVAGDHVTAFVRDASKLEIENPNLEVVAGDVLSDTDQIRSAIVGRDSVIVALGAGAKGRVRSIGTRNVIAAMRETGVRHLICQSTLGAGDSFSRLNFKWKLLFRGPLRWAMADHERQEQVVRESGLDWTIVRPAAFSDGPATGSYFHGDPIAEKQLTLKVSRADVAQFLLRQLGDRSYLSKSVSLSY
ncbi:MAG: SDR family oxidoreductase [Planctomycetota bacterium]